MLKHEDRMCEPETEDEFAMFDCSISRIALALIAASTLFFVLAGFDGLSGPEMGKDRWSNDTGWQLEHYHTHPNGTHYYFFPNDQTGELEYRNVSWAFPYYLKGYIRYSFGTSWANFCLLRNKTEVVPNFISLYRLMQMRPYGQSFIRLTVLGTMGFRVFVTLFVVIARLNIDGKSFGNRVLAWSAMLLISFECMVSFFLTNLQSTEDSKIMWLFNPSAACLFVVASTRMIVMLLVFPNKKSLSERLLGFGGFLCFLCVVGVLGSAIPIFDDIFAFKAYPQCDMWVSWDVMFGYMILIISLFTWSIYEAMAVSEMHILVVPQIDELQWDMSG